MEKKAELIDEDEWLKNLPIKSEEIAFKPEEMILCGACQRTNPPNRLNCVYCGKELEHSGADKQKIKPNLRKLEIWEKGFNLIYQPDNKEFNGDALTNIAKTLNLESEAFEKICSQKMPLPIARVESQKQAEFFRERLFEFGFQTFVLSDEKLLLKNPPKRLRGIEFFDDKMILIFFNTDEIAEISAEDLVLLVTGAIFERRTEQVENRKKGKSKILKATETASDEILFDIYTKENAEGFRVFAKGFDFSCLEAEKEILATENLKKLMWKLQSFAPNLRLVENYLKVREILGNVWETEEINDSKGLHRQSFGKFNLENAVTVTNWSQFNKFSRLQWHLL